MTATTAVISRQLSRELTKPASTSSSIFELDEELQRLIEEAYELESDGEPVPTELLASISEYFEASVSKVDRIVEFIKHLKILDTAKKAEKARLDQRSRAETNKCERVAGLLKFFMQSRGLRQIKGKLNTVSLVPNSGPALEIPDARAIPDDYRLLTVSIPKQAWIESGDADTAMAVVQEAMGSVKESIDEGLVKTVLLADLTERDKRVAIAVAEFQATKDQAAMDRATLEADAGYRARWIARRGDAIIPPPELVFGSHLRYS